MHCACVAVPKHREKEEELKMDIHLFSCADNSVIRPHSAFIFSYNIRKAKERERETEGDRESLQQKTLLRSSKAIVVLELKSPHFWHNVSHSFTHKSSGDEREWRREERFEIRSLLFLCISFLFWMSVRVRT